jgi:hypothetical protein
MAHPGQARYRSVAPFGTKFRPFMLKVNSINWPRNHTVGFADAFTQLASEFSDTNAGEIARIQKAYLAELEAVPKVKFHTTEADDGSLDDDFPLNDSSFSNTKPSVLSQRAVSLSNR